MTLKKSLLSLVVFFVSYSLIAQNPIIGSLEEAKERNHWACTCGYISSKMEKAMNLDHQVVAFDPETQSIRSSSACIAGLVLVGFIQLDHVFVMGGMCRGRWAYNEYKVCGLEKFGAKSYLEDRSDACGVETYKSNRGEVCGAESYKSGRDVVCGVELYNVGNGHQCGVKDRIRRCIKKSSNALACMGGCPCKEWKVETTFHNCRHADFGIDTYNSCRHSSFGIDTYNSCRHSSFGVETYNRCVHKHHGVKEWNLGSDPVCGVDTASVRFSDRGLNRNGIHDKSLALVNDGTSSCTTCDDLPDGDHSQIQKRFKCLKASIQNYENGVTGYGKPDFDAAFSSLKDLQIKFSSTLSDEDHIYVMNLIDRYPFFDEE